MNVRAGFLPSVPPEGAVPLIGEMLRLPWQTGAQFGHNNVIQQPLAKALKNPAPERAPIAIEYLLRMAELAYAGHENSNPPIMKALPFPSQVYTARYCMECAGLLVCARTLVEGSTHELTAPFFMIVGSPTGFCGDCARSSIWKRQADGNLYVLPPTMITGPDHFTHPVLVSSNPSLCNPGSMTARSPWDYLDTGTIVCFNEDGRLFHFVKGPAFSDDDGEDFMDWFGQHPDRDAEILWPPPDRDNQLNAVRYGYLENLDTVEEGIHTGQKCL
jgi:hypothetical protein